MKNAHRRNNYLDKIKVNGVWLTEKQDVRERLANAFHQLLLEDSSWKADIEGLHLEHLSIQEAESLELPFSEEEIRFALMEMNEEILELFKEFYDQSSFAKSLNTTFLVLIPKKRGVEDLGDFRPISLLGGLYKLLAKALLGKWIWRFDHEKDNLWKKVILVKYGQEGIGRRTNEANGTFGVGVWKEILKETNWCWENIEFKVGKGTKVKF
ncbi:hypothetical protein AAG906_017886 [Vitis piasezkii]